MHSVIVDYVPIVDPKLAAIIRNEAVSVTTSHIDSHATCPANSKVVATSESRPFAMCIPIVHSPLPTSHAWYAAIKILTPTALTKVENILSEETMAIYWAMPST
jgi:hypothetical protein